MWSYLLWVIKNMLDEIMIKSKNENILKGDTIYHWSYSGSSLGKKGRLIQWGSAFFVSLLTFLLIFLVAGMELGDAGFWILFFTQMIFLFVIRYLFIPDYEILYFVKQSGVHYTKREKIPAIAYKIVRVMAWSGVIVCIYAWITYGPMIFVGVGGFAVLFFCLTKFNPKAVNHFIFIKSPTLIINIEDEFFVEIRSLSGSGVLFSGLLHYETISEKSKHISLLKEMIPNTKIINVKCYDDADKYMVEKDSLS